MNTKKENLEELKQEYQKMLETSNPDKHGVYHCEFDVYDFGSKMISMIQDKVKEDSLSKPSSIFKEVKNSLGYDLLSTKVKDPYHFFPWDFDNQTIGGILTGMYEISYE